MKYKHNYSIDLFIKDSLKKNSKAFSGRFLVFVYNPNPQLMSSHNTRSEALKASKLNSLIVDMLDYE